MLAEAAAAAGLPTHHADAELDKHLSAAQVICFNDLKLQAFVTCGLQGKAGCLRARDST